MTEIVDRLLTTSQEVNLQDLMGDNGNSATIGEESFDSLGRKMVNLLLNGKIKKRILRKGYGEKPTHQSLTRIHYNAYVQFEAQPFYSTYVHNKPFTFKMGDGQCVEGVEIAVQTMKTNEKSQFLIDSELSFKDNDLHRSPRNTTILFEIELLKISQCLAEKPSEQEEKDFATVYKICLAYCVKGKQKFRIKDYLGAIEFYEMAIHKLKNAILKNYDQKLKYDEILCRLYTNSLICCTHHSEKAILGCNYATRIYDMWKNNIIKVTAKVYFNNAKCLKILGNFSLAEERLLIAKQMEPNDAEIDQELIALKKTQEVYRMRGKAKGFKSF